MTKKRTEKPAWPDYLKNRLKRLRNQMQQAELDAVLISNPPDIRYLTRFKGEDSHLLVTGRQCYVLSDFRFVGELERDCPFARRVIRDGRTHDQLIGQMVEKLKIRRLGYQNDYLKQSQHKRLVRQVGGRRLKPIAGWMLRLRSIKDERELRLIRRAIAIQEQAFGRMLEELEEGMTERQVAAVLEFHMKWLGAMDPSFATIVGIGANSALCHYTPGTARVKRGQVMLVDFGANYQGYCSDMTRTLGLGGMPRALRKVYPVVREALETAVSLVEPGRRLADLDRAARQVIERAGYGKQFGHGLGHGIGLNVHEQPFIGRKGPQRLEVGQILAIEPGIYLPGVGGVRIEDDILVTPRGHKRLCTLPTDLESMMIDL